MTDDQLRNRALRNLLRAAQEAGDELSYPWIAKGDPDFAVLRKRDPGDKWSGLMQRLAPPLPQDEHEPVEPERAAAAAEAAPVKDRAAEAVPHSQTIKDEAVAFRDRPTTTLAAFADRRLVALPDSPLGTSLWRVAGWALATAVMLALATMAATGIDDVVLRAAVTLALLAPAVVASLRVLYAWREHRPVTAAVRATPPPPPAGSSPRPRR